jgi:hypothetical protein
MCPVQWRPPSRRPNAVQFVKVPPTRYAMILDQPSEFAILALHWLEGAGQSTPCMGASECQICPQGVKVHVYTIALMYLGRESDWMPMIFDLGHPDAWFLQENLRGEIVEVSREKKHDKRSNVHVRRVNELRGATSPKLIERIDVRPHLMRRYGLFAEADYFAIHDHAEQQRLPFPSDDAEKETA